MIRIIARRVAVRQDHGQACVRVDLANIKIKGSGEKADADLSHFYHEWMPVWTQMERPRPSLMPAVQGPFCAELRRCPCVSLT